MILQIIDNFREKIVNNLEIHYKPNDLPRPAPVTTIVFPEKSKFIISISLDLIRMLEINKKFVPFLCQTSCDYLQSLGEPFIYGAIDSDVVGQ